MKVCAGFTDKYAGSVDPLWRQTFYLYIRDLSKQKLSILVESVTDEEEEENVPLGTAELPSLKELCDGDVHDITCDLQG